MMDAAAHEVAVAALLTVARSGDLDALAQYFNHPQVIINVTMWNVVDRSHRLHESTDPVLPMPWYRVSPRYKYSHATFFTIMLCEGRLDVLSWLLTPRQLERMGDTLRRTLGDSLQKCMASNDATSIEIAEVVFESTLFQHIMDDTERSFLLARLLNQAVIYRQVEWIERLITYGADPNQNRSDGLPLLFSCRGDRNEMVIDTLLQHGAWIEDITLATLLDDEMLAYPLRPWIQRGVDANDVSVGQEAALQYAVSKCWVEGVKTLLRDGYVDVDVPDQDHATPLMLLAKNKSHARESSSPKHDVFHELLKYGADLNAVDSRQRGVLHYAVRSWSPLYLRLLLERGVNPNTQDDRGQTPIYALVVYVQRYVDDHVKEMLDVLLNGGANPYLCDNCGVSTIELLASRNTGRRYMAENPTFFPHADTT